MDKIEADQDYGIEQMLARCAKQKDDCLEDPEQLYCALCGPIDEKQRKLQNYLKLIYEYGTSLYSRDPEVMCHKTGDRLLVSDILQLVWEMAEHIEGMVEDHLESVATDKDSPFNKKQIDIIARLTTENQQLREQLEAVANDGSRE